MKNEKTEPTMSELLEYVGTRKNFFNANAERLNREHLDALNAQIIRLSNDRGMLLSALTELVNVVTHPETTKAQMKMIAQEKRRLIADFNE